MNDHDAAPDASDAREDLRGLDGRSSRSDGINRRALCIGGIATAAMFGIGGLACIGRTPLLRPPGGQDDARLLAACIRCQRCYEACPRRVIAPARLEDGAIDMRTPTLDFDANWCDFCAEENGGMPLCAHVCPTGALSLADGHADETIIGRAVIDERQCLAYRDSGCRYCYDACHYDAIEMREGRPVVIADACNGCGACESVCVSLKAGAIAEGAVERAIVVKPLEAIG